MTGRSGTADPSPETARPIRAQYSTRAHLVAQEEIEDAEPGFNALEAVRRLRPEFLNRHATPMPGDAEAGYAVVYLDGVRLEGLKTLETTAASPIIEIRYLLPSAAVERLGKNHRGGVILVRTIR